MSLPPEKINELKQVIHAHLSNLDIHGQIRNVLSESLRENQLEKENVQESNLLESLKERGIVDDIMKSLEFKGLEVKSKSKVQDFKGGKNEKSENWIPDEDKKCE